MFDELTELLDPEPHDAALNMAIDEALLHAASSPILRVYRWSRPSVSFGYFGAFDSVAKAWPERDIVRRWTGGGVVQHGEDLTYTLIVPRTCAFFRCGARESYRRIHERLAAHLGCAGRPVGVASESASKVSDACFENTVAFDLVSDGAKLAGAAQRRTRSGLLHQGSIRAKGLSPGLSDGLASLFAPRIVRRELTRGESETAELLAERKYATDAWTRKF